MRNNALMSIYNYAFNLTVKDCCNEAFTSDESLNGSCLVNIIVRGDVLSFVPIHKQCLKSVCFSLSKIWSYVRLFLYSRRSMLVP